MLIYLIVISIVSFCLFGVDKKYAQAKRWRISENALLLSALFGGSCGALLGMYVFRHKTQKKKFAIGVPVILVAQIILLAAINM